jgi:hypothetical protein
MCDASCMSSKLCAPPFVGKVTSVRQLIITALSFHNFKVQLAH